MGITTKDRGKLLYLPDIIEATGMPEGTIRTRYHRGTMPCLWKLGRRLVTWEKDLAAWLDSQKEATTKGKGVDTQQGRGVDHYLREIMKVFGDLSLSGEDHKAIRAIITQIHDDGYTLGQMHARDIYPEDAEGE